MQITEVRAFHLGKTPTAFTFKDNMPPLRFDLVLVKVVTDTGVEGHCLGWLLNPNVIASALPGIRGMLVGRDPHEVEAISYQLTMNLTAPNHVASAIDICLWDAIGKFHNEPVYRLFGAARDKIRAYASTYSYSTVQEYVDLALKCRAEGFTAYKLHAFGIADRDIEVCRAVRAAVGDDMDLMIDPYNEYDRRDALRVGRVLDELNFYWYEAPIPDSDLDGLAELAAKVDTPLAVAESVAEGLFAYPRYLKPGIGASMRGIGDWIGGISALRKAAHACEAFHVKFEPHSYGTTLIQAAHLHVMLASHNCDFIEIPVPQGSWDFGMQDVIRVDEDGYVRAPDKPGLGYDLDPEQIESMTVAELAPPREDDGTLAFAGVHTG